MLKQGKCPVGLLIRSLLAVALISRYSSKTLSYRPHQSRARFPKLTDSYEPVLGP